MIKLGHHDPVRGQLALRIEPSALFLTQVRLRLQVRNGGSESQRDAVLAVTCNVLHGVELGDPATERHLAGLVATALKDSVRKWRVQSGDASRPRFIDFLLRRAEVFDGARRARDRCLDFLQGRRRRQTAFLQSEALPTEPLVAFGFHYFN